MRANNMLGVLFSNEHDEKIHQLTEKRAMGSVPFGGRYRLIDFPLSNMVNSGINKVGVITKNNYQSLMDHLGSGKAWDLSRKREGLFILPPFGGASAVPNSRVEYLASITRFLHNSREEYIVLSDCDMVCNIDYRDVLAFHLEKGADITLVYRMGEIPEGSSDPTVYTLAPDGRVLEMLINPAVKGTCNHGMSILVMKREKLISMVQDCVSRNMFSFKQDFLQRNIRECKIYGYEFKGTVQTICSMNSYFAANMLLMDPKVRDDMPARYGLDAKVSGSIIADGCVIEGTVENCVLFRGVKVGKGAKLENCVIMQDTEIGENCCLNNVVVDKDVRIQNERSLMGSQSYPVYISKGAVV